MKKQLALIFLGFIFQTVTAQNTNDFWYDANEAAIMLPAGAERAIIPENYRTLALDLDQLKNVLLNAPMERTVAAKENPLIVALPMPDGEDVLFEIVEAPIMAPGLAAKYPMVKTFSGQGIDDRSMTARIGYGVNGFHAIISTLEGDVYIDPYLKEMTTHYISYFTKDHLIDPDVKAMLDNGHVHTGENHLEWLEQNGGDSSPFKNKDKEESTVVELHKYQLAFACTGEYANNHGGTKAGVMSAVVYALSRVNFIFEKEVSVRLELIENTDELFYLNPQTDPYTNGDAGLMLGENAINIQSVIGAANFDIGHVFSTSPCTIEIDGTTVNIAGVSAGTGTVCGGKKAQGVSCEWSVSDQFYIGTLCHELGHQFGAPHPWSNCNEDWNATQLTLGAAYEPGSGSTIMSYAGACGDNNVVSNEDYYFHVNSLETIQLFTREFAGAACSEPVPTENFEPEVEIPLGEGLMIPISTPFQLTGIATDPNPDDTLLYCWEQYNLGPTSPLGSPTGNAPSFRTFPPTENPTRIFPRIQTIVSNNSTKVEVLPTYSRNLTFRCVVRDNKWGGAGTIWEEISFDATDAAGPFLVTYPNDQEEYEVGEYLEVTWDVANTNLSPVNCQKVNILLSVNGGYDYPITLAEKIPNTGSYSVTIPDVLTNTARIKVEAADNIFFDISNWNSKILPPSEAGYAVSAGPFYQKRCLPENPVIDISTISLLGYDSLIHFEIVSGLPTGAVPVFSSNDVVPSENLTLTLDMTNVTDGGLFDLQMLAFVPGEDSVFYDFQIELVATDFSDFAITGPLNQEQGVAELATFTWEESVAAESYILQISNSPVFDANSIIETAIVEGNSYTSTVLLNISSVYYWRMKAVNQCREGDWSEMIAFATKAFTCTSKTSNDGPINISANGLPSIQSIINLETEGVINDLNIANIKGNHSSIAELEMAIVGPDGTEVILFSEVGCLSSVFSMGLDDEAPFPIGTDCPPNQGLSYQPTNPLSVFDGKNSQGEWTLKVKVTNTNGDGGKLEHWSIRVCSEANLNPPVLLKNEIMPVLPGQSRGMTSEFLLTEDSNNGPDEIIYTLVTIPQNGKIMFFNEELGIGDMFKQSSASAGNVKYFHDGSNTTTDQFLFTVTDGEGGLIATPQFNIVIDPDVIIGTENVLDNNSITIFPNPAKDWLNIGFKKSINEKVEVRIFNVQGQLLRENVFENVDQLIQMSTQNFADGIYLIHILTENNSLTKRVVVSE